MPVSKKQAQQLNTLSHETFSSNKKTYTRNPG